MTVKELLQEVRSLGFAEYVRLDESFCASANRAMRALFTERPVRRYVKLFALDTTPLTRISAITYKGGSALCLPLRGRAFSMQLFGRGRYTVTDSNGARSTEFDSAGELFRDFLDGSAEIRFEGESSFGIYGLCTYAFVYGDKKSSIPDGSGRSTLDLAELYPDFLAFASPTRDESGKAIEGAELIGSKILLPSGYVGEVNVIYARIPKPIRAEDSSLEIDLPESHAAALPLLIAYYMLLCDEPECAKEYHERYRDLLRSVSRISYERDESGYTDTTGWA